MKNTSTVFYTFEDKDGNAETFNKTDFTNIIADIPIIGAIELELKGENEKIKVPLLKGYDKPYDWAVTDEIGTEHYIYYEEG